MARKHILIMTKRWYGRRIRSIIREITIDELFLLAKCSGRVIQNINSIAVGGGYPEILTRMITSKAAGVKPVGCHQGDERFL
jgi:hypothetical protein